MEGAEVLPDHRSTVSAQDLLGIIKVRTDREQDGACLCRGRDAVIAMAVARMIDRLLRGIQGERLV